MIRLTVAETATPELLATLNVLVRELSQTAAPCDLQQLEQIIASPDSKLLLAAVDGSVVGVLALVTFRIPTGVRARIEDVAVLSSHRRMGIAELLTLEAIRLARLANARTIDLTSSPAKAAANNLYAKVGFERRETNVYRLALNDRALGEQLQQL